MKKQFKNSLVAQVSRYQNVAHFKDEGNVSVRLPELNWLDAVLPWRSKRAKKCLEYASRPDKELLLRQIIHSMYANGQLSRERSVVDIGSWLADNAIVWAMTLEPGDACIYAIDPSPENIEFGKKLGDMNNCSNIKWCQAVCSDRAGVQLYYKGKFNHARFNEDGLGKPCSFTSTTIDELVSERNWGDIGLLHVDVEGLEHKVLSGALGIIHASRPVILFEQHILKEDPSSICELISPYYYKTYMINEVLPGCNWDCRNFISVPKEMDVTGLESLQYPNSGEAGVWYAATGPALIPLED